MSVVIHLTITCNASLSLYCVRVMNAIGIKLVANAVRQGIFHDPTLHTGHIEACILYSADGQEACMPLLNELAKNGSFCC